MNLWKKSNNNIIFNRLRIGSRYLLKQEAFKSQKVVFTRFSAAVKPNYHAWSLDRRFANDMREFEETRKG